MLALMRDELGDAQSSTSDPEVFIAVVRSSPLKRSASCISSSPGGNGTGRSNWRRTPSTPSRDYPFDPVMAYLWNLKAGPLTEEHSNRLDQWLFGTDDAITVRCMKRYAVAAIQRVFEPGCQQRQVSVLLGSQYMGKTELSRALFSDEWYGG